MSAGTSEGSASQRRELHLSYRQLDPDYNYYAITEIDELRDHYTVTFSGHEWARCTLGVSRRDGPVTGGCGFPAEPLSADDVPPNREGALGALRAEVERRYPEARRIRARYDGSYRRVVLEEFRPCNFRSEAMAHGHAYSRVAVQFDEGLAQPLGIDFMIGSECGARYCYWCADHPKWIPLRSPHPLLGIPEGRATLELPDELLAAVVSVLREPDRDWSPPQQSAGPAGQAGGAGDSP